MTIAREVVLVDGARSAFGKRGGMFKNIDALDLGAHVTRSYRKDRHFEPHQG